MVDTSNTPRPGPKTSNVQKLDNKGRGSAKDYGKQKPLPDADTPL